VLLFALAGSKRPALGALVPIPRADGADGLSIEEYEAVPAKRYATLLQTCDIVHDCSLSAQTAEQICKLKLGVPHVTTLNGISYSRPRPPANHNIIVVSEAAKKLGLEGTHAWKNTPWERQFALDPGKLVEPPFVVPYGLDTDFYAPQGLPRKGVLYVGRPHPSKGIEIVLALAARMPDQQFTVAWRADLADHKQFEDAYVESGQKLPNFRFVELPSGPEHQIVKRDLQASAKIAIHPAVYVDACPSTPLEALCCGTPVVATNHGGVAERVLDTQDGELIDIPVDYWKPPIYEDWIGVWERMIRNMLAHPERYAEAEIRARALERHSAQRMAEQCLEVYAAVIAKGPCK
jgi:glycosyltransferase involved in cell wall biosynthesis